MDEAVYNLLVVRFFKEGEDTFGDDGADAFDVEKVF